MVDTSTNPEPYQVLARRFRPRELGEVVGQQTILETLRQALAADRVPHAFLFSGSRGVGKTTLARILARCLNCERGVSPTPCGECAMCTAILEGSSGDVREIDAASHNGVDDIRELRERVGFASMGARYKVYILDEVHMLSKGAFNAFLKTLEEPPPGVVFILATTELHKVPDTIQSRCQVLLFSALQEADIVTRLGALAAKEELRIPAEVLLEIARAARGGMRDSETMLERILPVAREKGADFGIDDYRRVTHRAGLDRVVGVVSSLLQGEAAPALHFVDELVATGVDERGVLGEILEVLRAVLLLKVDGAETGLVPFGGELRRQLQELADGTGLLRLDAMIQAGLLGRDRIRRLDDRRLVLEISLLRMAEAGRLPQLAELIDRVAAGAALTDSAPVAGSDGSGATRAAPSAAVTHASSTGALQPRLLELCRDRKGVLTASLELCKVREPQDGVVRIDVQTDRKLHRDRLASRGVQDDIRGMIEEILGTSVTLDVRVSADRAGSDPAPAAPRQQESSRQQGTSSASKTRPGPAARKVVDRFDGRIVEMDGPPE